MNICHVITRLIVGGAQENTILTCRGLTDRGHQVTLIAGPDTGSEGSLWDQARDSGFAVIRVDSLRRAVRPFADWRTGRQLRSLFERLSPDIVHTHSSKAGILGRDAAMKAHVPVIVHTIHGMSFNRTQPAPTRMFYRLLERRAARPTTAFVTVADAMIDQAVAAGLAPRSRFTTIRSGIETERFVPDNALREKFHRAWNVREDEVAVGTVARLFANKGYEELLAALPLILGRNPRVRFVWIGDGPGRPRYERRLEQIGVRDRVHFVGRIPPADIPAHLNGFDMLVHASRWEGLPRVVVEALLMEVPAVSFDNDGAPEVVRPHQTGLLVPFGNIRKLAAAVVTLSNDKPLRDKLGRQGRAHCLQPFSWHRMVSDVESLYLRLLSAAPHGPTSSGKSG